MNPMPSGEGASEAAEATGGVDGAATQTDELAAAMAVDQAGGAAARQALGCARSGAEAAMQATPAIRHGRLAAAATRACARAATR